MHNLVKTFTNIDDILNYVLEDGDSEVSIGLNDSEDDSDDEDEVQKKKRAFDFQTFFLRFFGHVI